MAECSAETLHQRDHAFEVGGVLGVRAALSADSRVRPQIVTHGLEQGPPRAAGAGGHPRGVRPELLNRIDEIVVFHTLGRDELARIVEIQLGRLSKLLSDKQLKLELTDRAKVAVGKAGYDPVYGARPLKRALQRLVLDPLAIKVLKGDFKPGDTIRLDASASDDVLSFSRVNGSSGAEKAATLH